MNEIRKSIKELKKVLRKGGYLFWEGPTYKANINPFHAEKFKQIEPGTLLSIGGPYNGHMYYRFKNKEEIIRLLKSFKIIRLNFRGENFSLVAQKL
ncbi:MAG: hypothetical protein ACP5RT_01790 [Candidatus Micrarchaeia archaeon]